MVGILAYSGRVIVPPSGYLKEVEGLCKKHNILFIADEVQCGLGRAGANLAHHRDGVRPDMVVVAKALAGGKTFKLELGVLTCLTGLIQACTLSRA